jgi:hypothetical protein
MMRPNARKWAVFGVKYKGTESEHRYEVSGTACKHKAECVEIARRKNKEENPQAVFGWRYTVRREH